MARYETAFKLKVVKSFLPVKAGQCCWRGAGRLLRDFSASVLAQKWVTDLTEFSVKGHKPYLSACMDLYNGRIAAHHMARRPVFELASCTMEAAFPRAAKAAGLILHSDQSWHYKMRPYWAMLARWGITQMHES